MTRPLPTLLLLICCALLLTIPALAADTEIDPDYIPEGPVIAGQQLTINQTIFVGERFNSGYTLELDTDLTSPRWEIALIVQNRTTRTWDIPYTHAQISGFTISTAEHDTWLAVTEHDTWLAVTLTGTPAQYDTGKKITLWQMKVKLANGATKDTFTTKPVTVEPAPAPTAGPIKTTVPTTLPATPSPTAPTTAPTTEQTTKPTTQPITLPVPETPQSPLLLSLIGIPAALTLTLLRRT